MATKFVILDPVRQRRGNRDYIMNKPYARLVARLAPVTKAEAQRVPPFNPFKLYANTTPLDAAERPEDGQQDATVKIVELLGGILPSEDGQELERRGGRRAGGRARRRPTRSRPACGPALRPTRKSSAGEMLAERSAGAPSCRRPTRRVLQKSVFEAEDAIDDLRGPRGARRQGAARRHAGAHPAAPGRRDLAGPRHDRCGAQRASPRVRCSRARRCT